MFIVIPSIFIPNTIYYSSWQWEVPDLWRVNSQRCIRIAHNWRHHVWLYTIGNLIVIIWLVNSSLRHETHAFITHYLDECFLSWKKCNSIVIMKKNATAFMYCIVWISRVCFLTQVCIIMRIYTNSCFTDYVNQPHGRGDINSAVLKKDKTDICLNAKI